MSTWNVSNCSTNNIASYFALYFDTYGVKQMFYWYGSSLMAVLAFVFNFFVLWVILKGDQNFTYL